MSLDVLEATCHDTSQKSFRSLASETGVAGRYRPDSTRLSGAPAIWENAVRILRVFCVFGVNHALRPLRGGGMLLLQAQSNGLEIQ